MTPDVLVLENVSKSYHTIGKWGYGLRHRVLAVRNVSLRVRHGEISGLMGESGSGKSTLARLVVALEQPTSGRVLIDGKNTAEMKPAAVRNLRRDMQIVYQNPYAALDPSQTVGAAIEEPLLNLTTDNKLRRMQRILQLMHEVGLPERLVHAYPHQLSGGERQRICIARALAPRPKLLICDEPVSSLDKSIQAQILNLLRDLQQRQQLAYLFISHDLAVVSHLCTRVAVMLRGRMVEEGNRLQVLLHGAHPYTRCLIEAAAYFTGDGIVPKPVSAANETPQDGCVFQDRCLHARSRCRQEAPPWQELTPGHRVACHFPLSGTSVLR